MLRYLMRNHREIVGNVVECTPLPAGRSKFQHKRHAPPMLLFVRGNRNTRDNIWKFSVEGLQYALPTDPNLGAVPAAPTDRT